MLVFKPSLRYTFSFKIMSVVEYDRNKFIVSTDVILNAYCLQTR